MGRGTGDVLAGEGGDVLEDKGKSAVKKDGVETGEGGLCDTVRSGEGDGKCFGRKVELEGGNSLVM